MCTNINDTEANYFNITINNEPKTMTTKDLKKLAYLAIQKGRTNNASIILKQQPKRSGTHSMGISLSQIINLKNK